MSDPNTLSVGGVLTTLSHLTRRIRGHVSFGLQAEFCSYASEFLRVHVAPVRGKEPQGHEAAFGEEGLRQRGISPDVHEATVNHGPRWRWDFLASANEYLCVRSFEHHVHRLSLSHPGFPDALNVAEPFAPDTRLEQS